MKKKKFNAALYKAEKIAGVRQGDDVKTNDKRDGDYRNTFEENGNSENVGYNGAAWFQRAVPAENAPERCVVTGSIYAETDLNKTLGEVAEEEDERLVKTRNYYESKTGLNEEEKKGISPDGALKNENPNSKNNGGKKGKNTGFKIAVVTLSVALAVTAGLLGYVYFMPEAVDYTLEASYRRAFNGAVTYVDNMDLYMSKILATKDRGARQKYLSEVIVNAELCENGLQELPLEDESKFYTTKLVNQVGDYSKYLNKKLIDGKEVSAEERKNYETLLTGVEDLKECLFEISADLDSIEFVSLKKDGIMLESLNDLQNVSSEYPELIYDGPFSDGKTDRKIKGLSGEKIDEAAAEKVLKETFLDCKINNVKATGKNGATIPCFIVTAKSELGEIFALVSEVGGKLIMVTVNYDDTVGGETDTDGVFEEDVAAGYAFLEDLGITGMKAVWSTAQNGVSTVNYAYEVKGVICYSDLIKVKIANKKVIGLEASEYYTNHTERTLPIALFDKDECAKEVFDGIEVTSVRKALVPIGSESEVLCYEYAGVYDGSVYYVYISAIDKKQVEMFKVVSGSEGDLLM